MRPWVTSCSAVVFALACTTSPAVAQRAADLHPVGVVGREFGADPLMPRPKTVLAPEHHALWPWFALGGAVLGAGTVVVMAATHCDAGCRDDGGWAFVPAYAAVGAGIGALAGAVLGVVVDLSRREEPAGVNDKR